MCMTSVEKLRLEVPIINVMNTFKYVYFFGSADILDSEVLTDKGTKTYKFHVVW